MKRQSGNQSNGNTTCRTCRYFRDDPLDLEQMFPSILILSSTYGSTRGRAGICEVSKAFHDPEPACPDFLPR